eukprot:scaffold2504_cov94-Cylindrotheca_fusiformis.AAC.6
MKCHHQSHSTVLESEFCGTTRNVAFPSRSDQIGNNARKVYKPLEVVDREKVLKSPRIPYSTPINQTCWIDERNGFGFSKTWRRYGTKSILTV